MSGPGQRQEAIRPMAVVGEEGEGLLFPEMEYGPVGVDYLWWSLGKTWQDWEKWFL